MINYFFKSKEIKHKTQGKVIFWWVGRVGRNEHREVFTLLQISVHGNRASAEQTA